MWTLSRRLETGYVTSQTAFQRVMDQLVAQISTASGVVALRELDLAGKRIKASNAVEIFSKINHLTTITDLSFQYCRDLRWDHMVTLENVLPHIRSLRFVECSIIANGTIPSSIVFSGLTSFEISGGDFTTPLLAGLARVSTMKQIVVSEVRFCADASEGGPFFATLSSLQSLETFRLNGTKRPGINLFSEQNFAGLNLLTRLSTLGLVLVDRNTKANLGGLPVCPSIESLRLGPVQDVAVRSQLVYFGFCQFCVSLSSRKLSRPRAMPSLR